jgi:hypothetical protein
MKLLRILFTSAAMLLGLIAATTVLPVPSAEAIWPFGGVRAHTSRGLWVISNSKNVQVGVKYRAKVKGSDIWAYHNATVPANSDRVLGYDAKTYRLQVVSHTP